MRLSPAERRHWGAAGGIALAGHLAIGAVVVAWVRPMPPPVPEPVVLVELPSEAATAPADTVQQAVERPQQSAYVPPQPLPPSVDIAPVRAPLPENPVAVPPSPQPLPVQQVGPAPTAGPAVVNPVSVASAGAGTGASPTPGSDPKARQQEANYFALVSAHLNRRKTYPAEARKSRQQGVVTVRFTVDRNGNVSGASIKRGSGHEILDRATLDLLTRVAPLPRMPSSMQRDSVTLSLPIEYSLRTS